MNIAIVGAGISGSLTAKALMAAGHKVTVFEKSRGRGGRCSHKRLPWGVFDLGAPVIPAKDPQFIDFMQQQVSAGVAHRWPNQAVQFDGDNLSSMPDTEYFVFARAMNQGCKAWLGGASLVTQFKVTDLSRETAGWYLLSESEQREGPFDWVVLTAPWPQTHPLLAKAGVTKIALEEQNWSACMAIHLQFCGPLSVPDLVYARDTIFQTLVHESKKPQRNPSDNIWGVYLRNQASMPKPEMAIEPLLEQVLGDIQRISGGSSAPAIKNMHHHWWRFARPSHGEEALGILWEPELHLGAIGDWSLGASVQSAFVAAQQLAARL